MNTETTPIGSCVSVILGVINIVVINMSGYFMLILNYISLCPIQSENDPCCIYNTDKVLILTNTQCLIPCNQFYTISAVSLLFAAAPLYN